ncbi:MAG: response regulator [Flavobacteriales bacterium]
MKKKKINILYVDDERINLLALKSTFRNEFTVFTATDTNEATKILTNEPIHVVFADQRMPIKTGVEFFEEIKNIFPLPIRVLITAYSDMQSVIDGINKGHVYKYLKKPWDVNEIRLVVKEAHEVYSLRRQNISLIKKYKELFNQSYEPILLVNTEGKISECNRAAEDLFGKQITPINGRPINEILIESPNNFINLIVDPGENKETICRLNLTGAEEIPFLATISEIILTEAEYYIQVKLQDISQRENFKKKMLKAIYEAQDSERQRISAELHDSLGQVIAFTKLKIDTILLSQDNLGVVKPELNQIIGVLESSLAELNSICNKTFPIILSEAGLIPSLEELSLMYQSDLFYMEINSPDEYKILDKNIAFSLYRIIQEFTNNAIIHGQATCVRINFEKIADTQKIILHNNGKPFNTEKIKSYSSRGLKNILSRAASINAELSFISSAKEGTTLTIAVPLA